MSVGDGLNQEMADNSEDATKRTRKRVDERVDVGVSSIQLEVIRSMPQVAVATKTEPSGPRRGASCGSIWP